MKLTFIPVAIIILSLSSITASAQFRNNRSLHDENCRIRNGIRSGQLTGRETALLKMQAANIRREAIRYKMNDGRIGPRERADLRRDQRKLNRNIFRQRHDRQVRF